MCGVRDFVCVCVCERARLAVCSSAKAAVDCTFHMTESFCSSHRDSYVLEDLPFSPCAAFVIAGCVLWKGLFSFSHFFFPSSPVCVRASVCVLSLSNIPSSSVLCLTLW